MNYFHCLAARFSLHNDPQRISITAGFELLVATKLAHNLNLRIKTKAAMSRDRLRLVCVVCYVICAGGIVQW